MGVRWNDFGTIDAGDTKVKPRDGSGWVGKQIAAAARRTVVCYALPHGFGTRKFD